MKQGFSFIFAVVVTLVTKMASAAPISCPVLQCSEPILGLPIDYDLCLNITETQPMTIVKSYDCDWYIAQEKSNLEVGVVSTCDFTVETGEFAWVNELTQGIDAASPDATVANSQFHKKRTLAYCREVAALNQNLNNGRSCSSSFQCRSGVCEGGLCVGLEIGVYCNNHGDCAEGLFCEKSAAWPWQYSCAKLRTSYQVC